MKAGTPAQRRNRLRRAGDRARATLADPAYRFALAVIASGACVGGAVVAFGGLADFSPVGVRLYLFMTLACLGELWLMRVPSRTSWTLISASSLFTLATLVVFGIAPAAFALALGSLIKDVRARRAAVKVLFNIAQHVISVTAAGLVYVALGGDGGSLAPVELPAVVAAGMTFLMCNSLLTGGVVALATGTPLPQQLRQDIAAWLLIEGVMLGFAPVVVVGTEATLWLLPMLALPFLGVQRSAKIAMRSEHEALHDSLTGLPNRVLFRRTVDQALERRPHGRSEVVVLMLDLDRFKEVNDTLGHGRGDLLLQQLADRLGAALREVDVVARLGGDEFGIVWALPAYDEELVAALARRISDAVEPPFDLGELSVDARASVGIAVASLHGDNAETLIQRADIAMYGAKERGSSFEVYDVERDPNGPERLQLARDLHHGIHEDQVVVHYQPKVDVATGRLTGFEALARWAHPVHGLLPPDAFIGLAERSDAIRALTASVVEDALRQAAAWRDAGHPVPVAVNLSARLLLDARLPDEIVAMLDALDVEPSLLELEVTESSIIADPDRTADVLARLHRAGVRISIDDFGTGYSSLALLRRLPVDVIKIDRSFVGGMTQNVEDAAIVESTVRLADSLGLGVVAEGVDCVGALDALRCMGCSEAQGFFVCRPQPAAALGAWVRDGCAPGEPGAYRVPAGVTAA